MRSCGEKNCDAEESSDVLPDDVAPLITMFARVAISCLTMSVAAAGPKDARGKMRLLNLRMLMVGPSTAIGGMTTHAREPSDMRASRIGDMRSIRRPDERAICSTQCWVCFELIEATI